MLKICKVLSLSAMIAIAGCSTLDKTFSYETGSKISQQQLSEFKEGKTTKKQVKGILGAPDDMQIMGSDTHYIYSYNKIGSFSSNDSQKVRFIFNKKNVLKELLVSKGGSSNPLLDAANG